MLPNGRDHCHRDYAQPGPEHFDEKVHLVDLYVYIHTHKCFMHFLSKNHQNTELGGTAVVEHTLDNVHRNATAVNSPTPKKH